MVHMFYQSRQEEGVNMVGMRVSKRDNHLNMETFESNTQSITATSSLSHPKSYKKTNSHKIENLIKYSHVLEDDDIFEIIPSLLSLYNIFKRQNSIIRSIRNLISTNHPHMEEYVGSSWLDQCTLRAKNQEQYVDLEISQYLINHWKTKGYTTLHFGVVMLILSLNKRKNQPVFCKITILYSSNLHYENVVISTVLTTFHVGSVVLTIFPNYNVSLNDNTLSTRLKVQVKITGSDQVPEVMSVTLHH